MHSGGAGGGAQVQGKGFEATVLAPVEAFQTWSLLGGATLLPVKAFQAESLTGKNTPLVHFVPRHRQELGCA